MMDKAQLKKEFNDTVDRMIYIFSGLTEEQINQQHKLGNWTAGMVGEHITKSMSGITDFFSNNIEPVRRPYDENVQSIKDTFLDFSIKMRSHPAIVPAAISYDKKVIIAKLEAIKADMANALANCNLTMLCKGFEFPNGIFLTCYEWVNFFTVHLQRHIHQLKNIVNALK